MSRQNKKYLYSVSVLYAIVLVCCSTLASAEQVGLPGTWYDQNESGRMIHRTTDGVAPTKSDLAHTPPVMLSSTAELIAKPWKSTWYASAVKSADYMTGETVATPTFSPDSGRYIGPVDVTISCVTPGVTIHYTTNGATPTGGDPIYTGPVTISSPTVLKAKAWKSGLEPSQVKSANYIITGGITGTVNRRVDGLPVPGLRVCAFDIDIGTMKGEGYTDANGVYEIGLFAGTYSVQVSTYNTDGGYYEGVAGYPTPVVVNEGERTSGVDFVLAWGGSITGAVTRDSDGSPISGLWVYVYDYNAAWWTRDRTDANGVYEIIDRLYTGTYRVRVDASSTDYIGEYYDDVFDWDSATPVAVTEGQETSNIDIGLSLGGIITGAVTRDLDGSPIPDLWVCARDYYTGTGGMAGKTGLNGTYEIKKLLTGTYKVWVDTYNTDYIGEYYDDAPDSSSAAPVNVILGQETSDIDFGLAVMGNLAGTVTRESDGLPISDLRVYATEYYTGSTGGSGVTDANGFYEIKRLPAGTYRVRVDTYNTDYFAEYYDDVVDPCSATPVAVNEGQQTSGIDFSLAIGGRIRGTVTRDSDGAPISGLWVYAYDYETGSWRGSGLTDANGFYEIRRLPTGTYRVQVDTYGTEYLQEYYDDAIDYENATPVNVVGGQQAENINFGLGPGASISGRVVNSSEEPLENVTVRCCSVDGHCFSSDTTDTNGIYEFRKLAPGDVYSVPAYPPSDSNYVITRIYVEVPEVNDYTAQDIVLQTGALTVSGKVTDKATSVPLADIWVFCWLDDLDIWTGDNTDANGIYVLTNLPPGWVEIRAEPQSYYACIGTEFELTADVNNLDFALPVEATLSGKVLNAETVEPLTGIQVTYWSDRYAVWQDDYTNTQGRFTFTNLPPGIGQIKARPGVDTGYAWNLPWGSNWVYLNEGRDKSGRIIALQKGVLVTGYIKDPNGVPLSNVEYDWEGKTCEGWSDTDINGHYEIRLPLGTYTINLDEDDFGALPAKVTITDINQPVDVNDIIVYSGQAGAQISGDVNNPGGYPKTGEFLIVVFETGTVLDTNTWYTISSLRETGLEEVGPFVITALPPDANYDVYLCVASETADEILSIVLRDYQLNVAAGVNDVNLYYNSQGGTVTGSVTNTHGQDILGATVLLADSATGSFAGFGETDPNGEYVIYNAPAGTYTATAVHSKYLNVSTTVQVVDGVPADVNTIVMLFLGEKEAADLNGDGVIGWKDVEIFASQWLQAGSLTADFNKDSEVNFIDWARIAENWLWHAIWYNE